MKKCSKCKIEKDESEFYTDKSKSDNLTSYCKECTKEKTAKSRESNPEYMQEWRINNCENVKEYKRKYRKDNYENIKEYKKEYNPGYEKQRREHDPLYRLKRNVGTLIRMTITNSGFKKSSKTSEILGCTFEEFMQHIESQFQQGMSWDNRFLWHLDHIYPVSRAVDEEHLISLNHYTNFQPLWAADNIRKGNKLPEEFTINTNTTTQ